MTLKQFIDFCKEHGAPDNATVAPYEGEGGNWILVCWGDNHIDFNIGQEGDFRTKVEIKETRV